MEKMKHTTRGLGGDLIQLAFRTTKHRQSSHLDRASKPSVLNTCRKTFFGLVIIRNSGKEELGRKLRRRKGEEKQKKKKKKRGSQTHKTVNLMIPQLHEREGKLAVRFH